MDYSLRNPLIKLTSRVIDKKLTNLKEVLEQDNLNELVSKIDEHFTDFQTCTDLEDTIFCLEKYLNRRGIGGILTQIPEEINTFKVSGKLTENITLRGQTEASKQSKGRSSRWEVKQGDLKAETGDEIRELSEEYKESSESEQEARRKGVTFLDFPGRESDGRNKAGTGPSNSSQKSPMAYFPFLNSLNKKIKEEKTSKQLKNVLSSISTSVPLNSLNALHLKSLNSLSRMTSPSASNPKKAP